MTVGQATQTTTSSSEPRKRSLRSLLADMEIDTRLLGMIAALGVIWLLFNFMSDGLFLSPRNLWNLSVQSAAVGIMATGMVLVIVSRNIDLSIGSIVVFVAMFMALLQNQWIPNTLGLGLDQPYTWIITLLVGLVIGGAIGGLQGFIVAYIGVPSFIVTLGGLLVWRGFAFQLADGQTIAPLDSTFQLLGGGPAGALGETLSWLVGGIAIVFVIYSLIASRRRRRRYGFPVRPRWADVTIGVLGCLAIVGLRLGHEQLHVAAGPRGGVRQGARDPDPARRPADPDRDRDARHDRARRRHRHDLPRDPAAVRPIRLFHRRQPRCRGTGRHQHEVHGHEDVHHDGHPRGARRGRDLGPPERRDRGTRDRRGAAGHRGRRHRWHLVRRRDRDDPGRRAWRGDHAVAPVRHGAA